MLTWSPQRVHLRFGPGRSCTSICRSSAAADVRQPDATADKQVPAVLLADARTLDFVQWCKTSLDVRVKNLRPATFNGLRGMAAMEGGVAADDLVISIPRKFSLTLAPKQSCPCPELVTPEYWRRAPWFVQLGLMLLKEQRLGPASQLSRYVEQLPASFDTPVLWPAAKLPLLQYPHIIALVQQQQQEWAQLADTLAREGLQPGQPPVSRERFLWALCAVRSRTFSGPYIGSSLQDRLRLAALVLGLSAVNISAGLADAATTASAALAVMVFNLLYELILSRSLKQYAMCPLIDFMNHTSQSKSEVSLDFFSDRYSVQAGRDYVPGAEVFICYGDAQTNDSLLQFYGFTEPGLANDCYCLTRMLAWLEAEQGGPVPAWRMEQLDAAGLLEAVKLVTIVRKGFPAESLQAVRFLIAPEDQARSKGVSGFSAGDDAMLEQRLADVLAAACKRELQALGTTLEEDKALLSVAPGGQRGTRQPVLGQEERLAIAFRIEKKQVLRDCMAALGSS